MKDTTLRQKQAVWYCERHLDVRFEGNIHYWKDVTRFLAKYLDEAKEVGGFYDIDEELHPFCGDNFDLDY